MIKQYKVQMLSNLGDGSWVTLATVRSKAQAVEAAKLAAESRPGDRFRVQEVPTDTTIWRSDK